MLCGEESLSCIDVPTQLYIGYWILNARKFNWCLNFEPLPYFWNHFPPLKWQDLGLTPCLDKRTSMNHTCISPQPHSHSTKVALHQRQGIHHALVGCHPRPGDSQAREPREICESSRKWGYFCLDSGRFDGCTLTYTGFSVARHESLLQFPSCCSFRSI